MRSLALFVSVLVVAVAHGEDGECTASWADQASIMKNGFMMAKKMKEKAMPVLLGCHEGVKLTMDNKNSTKMCFKEMIMSSEFKDLLSAGELMEMDSMKLLANKILDCKLRYFGFENSLDPKEYVEKIIGTEVPDFIEDSNLFKMFLDCSVNPAGSTSRDQLRSIDKCLNNAAVQYCEMKGERVGLIFAMMSLMQTVDEEPKCTSVRVPDEMTADVVSCINKAKDSMGTVLPEEIRMEKDLLTMVSLLAKRMFDGIFIETYKCLPESYKKKFMNDDLTSFDAINSAEWVTSFPGWESIPMERDMVHDAIIECGDIIETETPMVDENEIAKNMWKDKIEFEDCFMTKFAKICGINNDVSMKLFAPFNKEVSKALMAAVVETTGQTGMELMKIMKDNFMSGEMMN